MGTASPSASSAAARCCSSWAPPGARTVGSAPRLQELHETYADLVVLAVDSNEDAGTVQSFIDENGLTYPIALDSNGEVADLYQIWAIPTLFFIDSGGVIRKVITESYSEEHVAEALAGIGVTQ